MGTDSIPTSVIFNLDIAEKLKQLALQRSQVINASAWYFLQHPELRDTILAEYNAVEAEAK